VPWKARNPVDLRMEMMVRLGQGEKLTDLCREYGISRKTGEKFKRRFRDLGPAGLTDQSRAPKLIPHKTPPELVEVLLAERRLHPTWGPRKIKEVLERRLGHSFPAPSTIGDVFGEHGLIVPRRRRKRHTPLPTGLREASAPNEVWCIDYKGQFRLGDGSYCYPLTITDQFSRFIVGCEGMGAICDEAARDVCEEIFRTRGVPAVMRSDNGVPFACTGLAGLTKLSAYWLRLGITLERIRPAHPQENGRHERMHRTLKAETTRPARNNLLQQQERFDDFVEEFNTQRPHEALGMNRPVDVYVPSAKKHPDFLPDPDYSTYDDVLRVTTQGLIHLPGRRQVHLTKALAGQLVGIREEGDDRWLVSFMNIDLGYVEPRCNRFTPITPSSSPEAT
jgi:transposase InsO family protein